MGTPKLKHSSFINALYQNNLKVRIFHFNSVLQTDQDDFRKTLQMMKDTVEHLRIHQAFDQDAKLETFDLTGLFFNLVPSITSSLKVSLKLKINKTARIRAKP